MILYKFIDYFVFPILSLSILLVFIRLFKGPRIVDRVVALDLIITMGIAIMTAYSIRTEQEFFLDVAVILALIAFLGTIAFSFYLVKTKNSNQS